MSGGVPATGGAATGGAGQGGASGGSETTSAGTSGAGAAATGGATTMGGATAACGSGGTSSGVTVQLDKTRQTMNGFGIGDTWAPAMSDADADALFDPAKGLGLSILHIGMGTDGNPMSSNIYSDLQKAQARGVSTFIASAWSAPANCKSNNSVNDGGHLLTSCYDSWSTTLAEFAAKVKAGAGVDLYGISPQNEPDFASCGSAKPCNGDYPSMLYTDVEMVNFVKVLGPKMHALSPAVNVIAPEPAEWLHLWTNNSAPGSADSLQGTGYDYGHALYADTDAWAQVRTFWGRTSTTRRLPSHGRAMCLRRNRFG